MIHSIQRLRGYISMTVGFVACPCHLPVTLPILMTLTAGTTIGVWLSANTTLIYIVSTAIFIGGLGLGLFWLQHDTVTPASDATHTRSDTGGAHHNNSKETCEACQSYNEKRLYKFINKS